MTDKILWIPILLGQQDKQPELAVEKETNRRLGVIEVTQDMQFRVKIIKPDNSLETVEQMFMSRELAKEYINNLV
jgi:hypothetical protein